MSQKRRAAACLSILAIFPLAFYVDVLWVAAVMCAVYMWAIYELYFRGGEKMSEPLKLTKGERMIMKECGFIVSGLRFSGTEHQFVKFIERIEKAAELRGRMEMRDHIEGRAAYRK